jgi:hypothetical protein
MNRNWERACWAGVVAITALLGGLTRKSPPPVADAAPKSERQGKKQATSSGTHRDLEPLPKDETELRKYANHALSTARRTERFQRLMMLLDKTTAENWNTLWKEYIRQTLEEGRIHETEWSLFMSRVGEVGGPEAMEYFTHNGQQEHTFNRREVLKGWAAVDPNGALAWLERQPAESQPVEFWGAVMTGAAANNSKLAVELLSRIPSNVSPAVVQSTADALIQTEGLGNTIHMLEELTDQIPAGGPMPAHLVHFYQMLKQRSDRINWLANSYPDMETHQPSISNLDQRFTGGEDK